MTENVIFFQTKPSMESIIMMMVEYSNHLWNTSLAGGRIQGGRWGKEESENREGWWEIWLYSTPNQHPPSATPNITISIKNYPECHWSLDFSQLLLQWKWMRKREMRCPNRPSRSPLSGLVMSNCDLKMCNISCDNSAWNSYKNFCASGHTQNWLVLAQLMKRLCMVHTKQII